jgi:hypothetical protein
MRWDVELLRVQCEALSAGLAPWGFMHTAQLRLVDQPVLVGVVAVEERTRRLMQRELLLERRSRTRDVSIPIPQHTRTRTLPRSIARHGPRPCRANPRRHGASMGAHTTPYRQRRQTTWPSIPHATIRASALAKVARSGVWSCMVVPGSGS